MLFTPICKHPDVKNGVIDLLRSLLLSSAQLGGYFLVLRPLSVNPGDGRVKMPADHEGSETLFSGNIRSQVSPLFPFPMLDLNPSRLCGTATLSCCHVTGPSDICR